MKTWKNITLNLPGKNLDQVIDLMFELDILSFTIKEKVKSDKSDWFQVDNEPIIYHGDTHYLILLVDAGYRVVATALPQSMKTLTKYPFIKDSRVMALPLDIREMYLFISNPAIVVHPTTSFPVVISLVTLSLTLPGG